MLVVGKLKEGKFEKLWVSCNQMQEWLKEKK